MQPQAAFDAIPITLVPVSIKPVLVFTEEMIAGTSYSIQE